MQVRRSVLRNSQEQQQQNNSFLKNLITKASEHSKRLTIIDTVNYIVLMVALITIMVVRSDLADFCVQAMTHVTTAHVTLRLGYSAKSAIENYQKILKSHQQKEETAENSDSEETLG